MTLTCLIVVSVVAQIGTVAVDTSLAWFCGRVGWLAGQPEPEVDSGAHRIAYATERGSHVGGHTSSSADDILRSANQL